MITMAEPPRKRKPGMGRPKMTEPIRKITTSFRQTEAFSAWLEGLVNHCRQDAGWHSINASDVIEKALIGLAKEKGYKPNPPKR